MKISKANKKYCLADFEFINNEIMEKVQSFPGFKKWKGRQLLFDPTGANINHICRYWPRAEWDEESNEVLKKYIESLNEAEKIRKEKQQKTPVNDDFDFKTKPFEHQRKAFYLSRDKKNFALLMEQGTGKTKVIIDNAAYLYGKGKITALVVIAPNGVHRNWLDRELPAHMPEWCEYKAIHYYSGMDKKHKERFNNLLGETKVLKVFAFNVEAFVSKVALSYMAKILISNKPLLVVDESSRIKSPSAKRTKEITKFSKHAEYKRILTGTPITKGPEDIYSQFKFLDSNILGYDSFYSFRSRYCIMGGYENRQIVSYRNMPELTKNIEGHSFRVLKSECLDLPKKIYQRHYVEMGKKQATLYKQMKKQCVAELNGEKISAPETITRMLRMQQILCGWFPAEKNAVPIENKNPRIEALKEILANISSKAIIWARFKADIRAIGAVLGDEAVSYYGDVKADDRTKAIDLFQNDPKTRFFIGQPQSGGIGLTLTAAEYAIYYSNSFDLESRLQSEDRCHRIGTTKNVTYIDIESPKTIDTQIIKALRNKKSLADIVTKDPMSIFMEEDK